MENNCLKYNDGPNSSQATPEFKLLIKAVLALVPAAWAFGIGAAIAPLVVIAFLLVLCLLTR